MQPRSSGGRTTRPHITTPHVIVADPAWRRVMRRPETTVARAACLVGGIAAVVLASDRAVQRLNARHRGRNKPTNVLTFAAAGPAGGELVLALGTIRREAGALGRRPAHHLAHLVLHGGLHLHGHDHHHAGQAKRMEREEARLLHRIGVPNPWRHL